MAVELVRNEAGPSVIITETNSSGGLIWQKGLMVPEAEALYRALGVTLAQV